MRAPTHLEGSLLYGHLAVDPSSIIRTHGLQLVFVEGEELSSGQHTQTVYSPVQTEHAGPHQSYWKANGHCDGHLLVHDQDGHVLRIKS